MAAGDDKGAAAGMCAWNSRTGFLPGGRMMQRCRSYTTTISFTSLRRRYRMVQDEEQGGVEVHEAHQEARVSKDYGSGAPGRSLPTAMVVLPTRGLACRRGTVLQSH